MENLLNPTEPATVDDLLGTCKTDLMRERETEREREREREREKESESERKKITSSLGRLYCP